MNLAIRQGQARYNRCVENNWTPYGQGDLKGHQRGRLGELIFPGWFDGSEPDPDWSWEADIARGKKDFIDKHGRRWGIRTTPYTSRGLFLKPDDRDGLYVLIVVYAAPRCYVAGWITKSEAQENHQLQPMHCDKSKMCWSVPQSALHPFLPR